MRKLSCLCFAVAALSSGSASAIATYKNWDGSQYVYPFGCSNTTTYGQVITVPHSKHTLEKFTFWWANYSSGSMVVRAEVYQWDGTKATGSAVFESDPRTISFKNPDFHKVTFPATVAVTPGAQYVLFASIDKDYEQCTDSYLLKWGLVADETYPDGTFVYQNNGGDESQWTSSAWSTYGGDLAFRVPLGP